MPNPTPAQIVTNPDPLNPAGFPFEVIDFPAEWLLQIGDFNVPKSTLIRSSSDVPDYEPGQI